MAFVGRVSLSLEVSEASCEWIQVPVFWHGTIELLCSSLHSVKKHVGLLYLVTDDIDLDVLDKVKSSQFLYCEVILYSLCD